MGVARAKEEVKREILVNRRQEAGKRMSEMRAVGAKVLRQKQGCWCRRTQHLTTVSMGLKLNHGSRNDTLSPH